jgi:hypothetical protein
MFMHENRISHNLIIGQMLLIFLFQLQAGFVLCDFGLCDLKIYITFQIYAIIFSLVQFGIDNSTPHVSSVGG